MNAVTVHQNINSREKVLQSQKPPPELLPFLDGLAELLAKHVLHELQNPCDQTEAASTALASCEMTKLQVEEFPFNCHGKSEQ